MPILAKLLDRQALIAYRFAITLVDFEAKEIDELANVLLAQQAQILNLLILDHELDEKARNALGLPLSLFILVIVGSILLDHASQIAGSRP